MFAVPIASVETLKQEAPRWAGCGLTIGNFDGVHRGHQAILDDLATSTHHRGLPVVALTFEPHPVQFFRPEHPPFRLAVPVQKYHLLRACGVDYPLFLSFDRTLADLDGERFVREILVETLAPSLVVVGYDFNFGKGRLGTPASLRASCLRLDIQARVVHPFRWEGEIVSSSRIRHAIRDGALPKARALLGRPYALVGQVVEGEHRGRTLGFPTANVRPANDLLPPHGVYVTYLETGGRLIRSVTNIGIRPTFGGGEVTVESFALEGRGEGVPGYGQPVALHLLERIRSEIRFDSSEQLVRQIERDVSQGEQVLREDAATDIVRGVFEPVDVRW